MNESLCYKGKFKIQAIDAKTGSLLWEKEFDNQLTEINRTIRTQMLQGTYTGPTAALQIKYFAFGTGTTPPAVTDTRLQAEQFRKQLTAQSEPSAGVVQSTCSVTAQEANFVIREIGVFCGASATSTANSGTLLSRVAVNIDKNSNIILNVVRSDICLIGG
jgi:hypothetical protein